MEGNPWSVEVDGDAVSGIDWFLMEKNPQDEGKRGDAERGSIWH